MADPIPSPFHNCLLLVDPLTPRCGHPLWMAPWHGSGHVIQATVYQLINPFHTTGLCPYSLKNRFSDILKGLQKKNSGIKWVNTSATCSANCCSNDSTNPANWDLLAVNIQVIWVIIDLDNYLNNYQQQQVS